MKVLRYWFPAIAWMCVIFFFSTRQRIAVSGQETVNFLFFKTLHVLEYAMLYTLLYRAVKNTANKRTHVGWVAFLLTVLYAASDEFHQRFVPTREPSVRDVIIDATSAACVWILSIKLLPKLPKRLRSWAKRLEIV